MSAYNITNHYQSFPAEYLHRVYIRCGALYNAVDTFLFTHTRQQLRDEILRNDYILHT